MNGSLRECVRAVCLTLAIGTTSCSPASTGRPSEQGAPPSEERTTVHVAMEGGQSGMEGGCPVREPRTLDFSIEDVRALVEGPHETTLANSREPGAARDLTVTVRLVGEPETVVRCSDPQLMVDAEVTLAFAKPALDVVIAVTLTALSSEWAAVELKLAPSVVAAMELPGVEFPEAVSPFLLEFSPRGPLGTIWVSGGSCGGGAIVRFPSEARCEPGDPELELTRSLYGVRPGDVLQSCVEQLSKWQPVPVMWDDGASTSLSMSIEEQPRTVCGGHDALFETGSPGYFQAPFGLRIKTSDGRVNLNLPANLVWQVYPEGRAETAPGWDGHCSLDSESDFQAGALRDARALSGVALPSSGTIRVDFAAGAKLGGDPIVRLAFLEWGPTCSGEPKPIAAVQTDNFPPSLVTALSSHYTPKTKSQER